MKKIMICVNLDNESVELFKKDIKSMDWRGDVEVHLINGFQLKVYADAFYFNTYPPEAEYGDIEKSAEDVLKILERELKSIQSKIQTVSKCIITHSPKRN